MRSEGDACRQLVHWTTPQLKRTYLNQLPIASCKQLLANFRTLLSLGELVIIALLHDAALVVVPFLPVEALCLLDVSILVAVLQPSISRPYLPTKCLMLLGKRSLHHLLRRILLNAHTSIVML